jgi:hypothetical protein
MDMLVTHLASTSATAAEIDDDLELDTSDARAPLRGADQRELSDALMACALAEARPEERQMLEAGYRLALERDRLASATR